MYDRTYLDGDKFDSVINGTIKDTNVLGLSKALNIKMYMYALALAHEAGDSAESVHRRDYASNSSIRNNYPEAISFMNALYLSKLIDEGNESNIDNTDAAYDIAERLVNAGLSIIDEQAKNSDEEAILFACLRKLDKKYEDLSSE